MLQVCSTFTRFSTFLSTVLFRLVIKVFARLGCALMNERRNYSLAIGERSTWFLGNARDLGGTETNWPWPGNSLKVRLGTRDFGGSSNECCNSSWRRCSMRQRKLAAPIARCPFPRSSTFDSPSNKGSSSFHEILSRSVGNGDWLPTPIIARDHCFLRSSYSPGNAIPGKSFL